MSKLFDTAESKPFLKDAFGWGFFLWLIGYALGFIFFAFVPVALIGWVIMPIATAITLWVLFKKVGGGALRYYLGVAVVWTVIAVIGDYLFIVLALHPADGYYKLDVYLYYILTFILPILIGARKQKLLQ